MKNPVKNTLLICLLVLLHSCKKGEVEKQIPPALSEVTVSDLAIFSARLSASITESGNQAISGHGFVISSTNNTPATGTDSTINKGAIDPATPLPIEISTVLTGLKNSTGYYVRAFALLPSGPVYSPTLTFKTADIIQPVITTDTATNITHNSARLAATVRSKGTYTITEYGIVWATTANPTTAVTTKRATTGNITTFPQAFTADITSLDLNTTYYFRSYVIANGVTTYGTNKTFRTLNATPPGIRTDAASNVNVNSARLSGTVLSAGTFPVSEHGIVWSTAANPTTAQNKVSAGAGVASYPRSYSVDINGLNKTTTYHFRAFVTSNGVTYYGANTTFTTPDERLPGITTESPVNVSAYNATLRGTVQDGGSYGVSEIGVCWGKNANPTTANSKASKGGGVSYPHSYSFDVGGLDPASEYHVRAYVVANGVTWYGSDIAFKTHVLSDPAVETGRYSVSTSPSTGAAAVITLYGKITGTGSYSLVEHGFVWSSGQRTPTLANADKLSQSTPGNLKIPFDYSLNTPAVRKAAIVYYYRSFVTTSEGKTFYGAVMTFTY